MSLSTIGRPGACNCGRSLTLYSGDYKWWGCEKCNALPHDCECERIDTVTILVNAQKKDWNKETISYEQLVELAGKQNKGLMTVMYSRGTLYQHEGTLVPGQAVRVGSGMVFDCHNTSNA